MQTLKGTLDAIGDCIAAANGYEIVVTDEGEEIIATTKTAKFPVGAGNPNNVCDAVQFTVEVPVRDFYTLRIGQHNAPTWSRNNLAAAEWDVHLLLNVDNCDVIFRDCSYLNTSPFVEA